MAQQDSISRAVVAVDVVIFTVKDGKPQVLLIHMKDNSPYPDRWAVPGGMVQSEESLDDAVKRHLLAKTGIRNIYVEQLATFGDVKRDPRGRVVSVAYVALIPSEGVTLSTSGKYRAIQWFPVAKLPSLGYDHTGIIATAYARLRAKLGYTNVVYSLLPREFTLSELQQVYEMILQRKLDKRNFRKKIAQLKLVKRVAARKKMGVHRPAQLYAFVKRSPEFVQVL
ncbi:MAG: NUDIX domain-containing protein [Patescibacteria group bacterium]